MITFKTAKWFKILIPFGVLFFLVLGLIMCYVCYIIAVQEKYYQLIFFIPAALFMFYLSNMGLVLFNYRNLSIEIENARIRLINNGECTEYKWNDGLTVKDRSGFKVYELFDSNGRRLFMIDYEFPNFSLLKSIINSKISNPNKDLRELLHLIEE